MPVFIFTIFARLSFLINLKASAFFCMLNLFRSYSPFAVMALFILALGLQLGFLSEPIPDTLGGNWIWDMLYRGLGSLLGGSAFLFSFFALLNVFLQALFLNRLTVLAELFPVNSYLPAFSYILLSALLPDWRTLTPALLANWFLLLSLREMIRIYARLNANSALFNIGFYLSLAGLICFPFFFMHTLLIWGIASLRPFKIREWLIAVLGMLAPVYFLAGILFLTDRLPLLLTLIPEQIRMPVWSRNPVEWIPGIALIFLLSIPACIYLNNFGERMLIRSKRYWGVWIAGLIFSLATGFFSNFANFSVWIAALPFFGALIANLWLEKTGRRFKNIFFYLSIAVVLFLQWYPL